MHDLNQIAKKNADAFFDEIAKKHAMGLTVVGTYHGLSLVEIEGFLDPAAAIARQLVKGESPDVNRKLFPLPEGGVVTGRDQSEDR